MCKSSVVVVAAWALLSGCGAPKEQVASTSAAPSSPPLAVSAQQKLALTLDGPNGTVSIGDDLATAKKAFPPPAGAPQFDRSMNFAILGGDGWAWVNMAGKGFEVALKDGR